MNEFTNLKNRFVKPLRGSRWQRIARTVAATIRRTIERYGALNQILFLGVTLAGLGATLMSIRKPWFSVPVAPPIGYQDTLAIHHSVPGCTPWFQAAVAMGTICIMASWLRKRHWTTISTVLSSLVLLVPLCYPYFVMIRSPDVSADAAWLQSQHDNLTWLGGDIYANAEYGSKGWKSKSYLIDTPRQLAVINLPSWSPWEVGLHRSDDLMLWLGYSNSFCQFVCKGWAMAIIGSTLLFLSTLQYQGTLVFHRAGTALVIFTIVGGLAVMVGWSLPFRASQEVRRAAELCSQRRYAESLDHLDRAVRWLPVLGQDTYYVAQRGVLDQKLGIDSDFATLKAAVHLESDACYDQAYAMLVPLIDSSWPAVRREALRGVMRFAIQDYNCARFELSRERFTIVLKRQPCNVKLIYLMQLQGIRESRVDSVAEMRDWMYVVSDNLNFGTKKVLRAVVQQHAVIASGMVGDADAIWAAQEKAKRP